MKKILLFILLMLALIGASLGQDTSAVNYWTRAGITDSIEQYAINTFVDTLKAEGIWSNCIAFNLVSPTCYGAAVNCLVGVGFTLHGNFAPNYSKNGFNFNGVNQYLQTGIIPTTYITSNNFTIVERNRTSTIGGIDFGCSIPGGAQAFYVYITTTQAREVDYSTTNLLNGTTTNGVGNYFFNTYSSNSRSIRKNKTAISTSAVAITGTQPNIEMYLGALNNNGTVSNWALREITSFGIFSPSLTIAKQNILSDALDAYNNTVITGGR